MCVVFGKFFKWNNLIYLHVKCFCRKNNNEVKSITSAYSFMDLIWCLLSGVNFWQTFWLLSFFLMFQWSNIYFDRRACFYCDVFTMYFAYFEHAWAKMLFGFAWNLFFFWNFKFKFITKFRNFNNISHYVC